MAFFDNIHSRPQDLITDFLTENTHVTRKGDKIIYSSAGHLVDYIFSLDAIFNDIILYQKDISYIIKIECDYSIWEGDLRMRIYEKWGPEQHVGGWFPLYFKPIDTIYYCNNR